MKEYLITGGKGFIGSKIVTAISGTSFDLKDGENILDVERLEKACESVSGIFHCAAKISVPQSILHPEEYYRTNVDGTRSVIDVANKNNPKIVFSSSAAVYGESSSPVNEGSNLHPLSPYAQNKLDGEKLFTQSVIPNVILRYFNVYGPGQSPEYAGVITSFIHSALKGTDLVIYGDGRQVRDFIFVDDVVRANMTAMSYGNELSEIFNIGSGIPTSILELAENIIKQTDSSSRIIYEPARSGDIVYSCSDITKTRSILNWSPEISLEEGLKRTVASMKNNLAL